MKDSDKTDDTIRIGETVYDLRSLSDPPIALWELLEKKGLLASDGQLAVVGMSKAFDFLHCALCATKGIEGIEAMIDGLDPPIPRREIMSIPTSKIQDVIERVSGVLGRDAGDPTTLRPTKGKSSNSRTGSAGPTAGRLATSAR